MVAVLEAQTSAFESRLDAASQRMNHMTSTTVGARRGVTMLRSGMERLAFSAAGIPGPLGQVAASIGALGIGTGPVMLAAAALGTLALAWKHMANEAKLAADNVTAAADRMSRNLKAAAGNASEERQEAFRRSLAVAEAQYLALWNAPLGPQRFAARQTMEDPDRPLGSPSADRVAELQQLDTVMRQLRVTLAGMEDDWASSERARRIREEAAAYRALGEAVARINNEVAGLTHGGYVPKGEFWEIATGMDMGALSRINVPAMLQRDFDRATVQRLERGTGEMDSIIHPDDLIRFQIGMEDAIGNLDDGGKSAGMIMARSFVMALPGLMQGGAAGVFGGLGILASGAGELKGAPGFLGPAGFALSAMGAVFGMFDNSEEKRHRELLEETRKIRENTELRRQPQRQTFTLLINGREITAAILDDVSYGLQRQARRNAEPALPSG